MNGKIANTASEAFDADMLNRLSRLELKYLVVKNFLQPDELSDLKTDLDAFPSSLYLNVARGYAIYPRTAFNVRVADEPEDIYFSSTEEARSGLLKYFKVGLADKFDSFFGHLNTPPAELMPGPRPGETFVPFNFRIMDIAEGKAAATSQIHNGSSITNRCINTTYKHLMHKVDFDNQLSFFCIIQNSTQGGEITIYDYPRREFPTLTQDRYLEKDGEQIDLETTEHKVTLSIEPGDLILFPGGQLWHRVESLKEGRRISAGGFMAPVFDGPEWYYWI